MYCELSLAAVSSCARPEAIVPMWASPAFVSRAFRHTSIIVRSRSRDPDAARPEGATGRHSRMATHGQRLDAGAAGRRLRREAVGYPMGTRRSRRTGTAGKAGGRASPRRSARGHRSRPDAQCGCCKRARSTPSWARRAPSSFVSSNKTLCWLFEDPTQEAMNYFRRTRIFPIMHLVGVRRSIVERQPWLPMALLKAFERSKHLALQNLADDVGDQGRAAVRRGAIAPRPLAHGRGFLAVRSAGQSARARSLRQASSRAGDLFAGRRRGRTVSSGVARESQDLKTRNRPIMQRDSSPEPLPAARRERVLTRKDWRFFPPIATSITAARGIVRSPEIFFALTSPGDGPVARPRCRRFGGRRRRRRRERAQQAFSLWRDVPPLERAKSLRRIRRGGPGECA